VAVTAVAVISTLIIGVQPAMAKEDAEHAKALAEATQAFQNAPKELGLRVKWDVVRSFTTEELKAATAAVPTGVELVVEEQDADKKAKTAAASGCKTGGAVVIFTGGVTRADLWRMKESVYFCWNERTVTNISTPEIEGHVYGPGVISGWRWRGPKSGPTNTAHHGQFGIIRYVSYVQGHFELCPPRVACWSEAFPWIRLSSYRDGTVAAEKGGA
jgi:hypothetical protein